MCLLEAVSLSSPSPLFALPTKLSMPGCLHPCLTSVPLHSPAKKGKSSHFHPPDSALFPFSSSQPPALCPARSGAVRLRLPIPAHLQHHREPSSPPHTLSLWHKMNRLLISPISPILQHHLLRCLLPVSQAESLNSKSSSILDSQTIYKEQRLCATKTAAQGRKVQYVFILGLYGSAFPPVLPPH